ncbi:MAG: HDIG domain-containing metalloprotein [Acidimicrobiia bacterium]
MSWDSPIVRRGLISLVTVLLVWAALALGQGRPGVDLEVGAESPVQFVATRTVEVVDQEATLLAREAARESVDPVFVTDQQAIADTAAEIEAIFDETEEIAIAGVPTPNPPELPPEPDVTTTTTTTTTTVADGEEAVEPEPAPEPTLGRVTGIVFLDADGDLVFDEAVDIALTGIDVTVVGSDDRRVGAATDATGTWAAEGVVVDGRVIVSVDLADPALPDSVAIASANAFQTLDGAELMEAEPVAFEPAWTDLQAAIDAMAAAFPVLDVATVDTVVELAQGDVLREAAGNSPQLAQVENAALDEASDRMRAGIRSGELRSAQEEVYQNQPVVIIDGQRNAAAEAAAADITATNLAVSEIIDSATTDLARDQAAAEVGDVTVTFRTGDVIVDEGDELTQPTIAAIEAMNLNRPTSIGYGAILALATVLVAMLFVYLARFRPGFWASDRRVALLGVILVVSALSVRGVYALTRVGGDIGIVLGYLLPAAGIGFLVSILLDARIAVLTSVALATMTGIVFDDAGFALYAALASIAPVALVSAISSSRDQRRAIFLTGIASGIMGFSVAWFFHESLFTSGFVGVLQSTAMAAAGGWVSSIIAIFLVTAFESVFDITTNLRLLELVDRNHAALQLIQEKAWGTFNHSLMVGTLADRAARAIGANPLLARAAAYYHDIGKTEAPIYFIENQFGVPNPHEHMAPEDSAAVIRAHVTDGLRLAAEYKVPSEVAEGILSHHGDGIMRYFYETAKEQSGGDVDAEAFRHAGHKPRSKEMAILMMADSLEGATRATFAESEPTPEAITTVVERVVAEKVNDGQLSESPLTLNDLRMVKAAFVEALVGHYHQRIPYPNFPDEPDALGGATSLTLGTGTEGDADDGAGDPDDEGADPAVAAPPRPERP